MKKIAFIILVISSNCFAGAFSDFYKTDSILPREMQDPLALGVYAKFPCFFDLQETKTSEIRVSGQAGEDGESRYFRTEMQAVISTGHLVFKKIPITVQTRQDLRTRRIEVLDVKGTNGEYTCPDRPS